MIQVIRVHLQTQKTYLKYSKWVSDKSQVHPYLKSFWGHFFHPPLYIAMYVHLCLN